MTKTTNAALSMSKFASQQDYWKARAEAAEVALREAQKERDLHYAGRWIAVGERLPEGDEKVRVLTCSHAGRISVDYAYNVRHLWKVREPGEDCYFSHWQPLPPAPDKEVERK